MMLLQNFHYFFSRDEDGTFIAKTTDWFQSHNQYTHDSLAVMTLDRQDNPYCFNISARLDSLVVQEIKNKFCCNLSSVQFACANALTCPIWQSSEITNIMDGLLFIFNGDFTQFYDHSWLVHDHIYPCTHIYQLWKISSNFWNA